MPMFRSKAFSVRRRFSDFLGLFEKLSVKQSLQGCIVPPPPEKSVMGESLSRVFCDCALHLFMFGVSLVIQVIWINRYDKSEGGNGRPILSGVSGEKKSSSGEVRIYVYIVTVLSRIVYIIFYQCVCVFFVFMLFVVVFKHLVFILLLLCFCRYLQRVVSHPLLLQDPDVREFLEREDVGTLI